MSKLLTPLSVFTVGGAGYALIEILWRGHTHFSMFIAGGVAFLFMFTLNVKCRRASFIVKCVACALAVITVELFFGLVFNMLLKMNVWDYSAKKMNFYGQICAEYAVYWVFLSAFICAAISVFLRFLEKRNRVKRIKHIR